MTLDLLKRVLQPIHRRLSLIVTRALVNLVDSEKLMQEIQVQSVGGETLDGIEHFEPYGYTSRAKQGAEALLAALGGKRSHLVAVSVADRRFRLKGLAEGEVAMYTDEGDVIHFKRGNIIEIKAVTKVIIDSPTAEFTGTVTAEVDVIAAGISLKSHTHPGDSGGSTGPPS